MSIYIPKDTDELVLAFQEKMRFFDSIKKEANVPIIISVSGNFFVLHFSKQTRHASFLSLTSLMFFVIDYYNRKRWEEPYE